MVTEESIKSSFMYRPDCSWICVCVHEIVYASNISTITAEHGPAIEAAVTPVRYLQQNCNCLIVMTALKTVDDRLDFHVSTCPIRPLQSTGKLHCHPLRKERQTLRPRSPSMKTTMLQPVRLWSVGKTSTSCHWPSGCILLPTWTAQ